MIEQIIVTVLAVGIVFIFGMLYGQHSVWRSLREKGHVRIDGWYYAAVTAKEGQYKCWD